MVVGGGPAGMKAASVAAQCGHRVRLYEREAILGGQVRLAAALPNREEFGGIVTNFSRELQIHQVEVTLNFSVDFNFIQSQSPDVVIVATGARPYLPPVQVEEGAQVVTAWDIIEGTVEVGHNVVIADWRCDWIGLGVAEKLARNGHWVRLAVNGAAAGENILSAVRDDWMGKLHGLGVDVIPYTRLFGADESCVYFQHAITSAPIVLEDSDTLVLASGHKSENSLCFELEDYPGVVKSVDDCLSPRTTEEAILEGLVAATQL